MSITMRRNLLLAALLVTSTGCGYQSHATPDGATVFHFASSTYAGVILVPLLLAGVAIAIIKYDRSVLRLIAMGGLAMLLLFAIAVLPGIWKDAVRVDNHGVTQATGFWWSPTVKGFQFGQTKEVRIVRKPSSPDNRVRTIWEITRNDGSTQDIDPGDLWDNAGEEIIKLTAAHGVTVRDMR